MALILLAIVFILASFVPSLFVAQPALADCPTLPAAQVAVKINVPEDGNYRIWLNQITPTDSQNGLFMQLDENCVTPIVKNDVKDVFGWVGSDAQGLPIILALSAGEHTIKIAGEQTSSAVDNGFFTTQVICQPKEAGDNCLVAPVPQEVVTETPVEKIEEAFLDKRIAMGVAGIWTVAFVVALAILVEKYRSFLSRFLQSLPGARWHKQAFLPSTFLQFMQHHPIIVAACGGALVALTIAFIFGASVIASSDQRFEAEAGTLSGGAKVVENALASGGSFVAFGTVPTPVDAQTQTPTNKTPTNPGTGGSNGGGGSGGDTGGGGGSTPVGECPPFPAFPDENCTGWQHTGVTLQECATDNGYIWDSNLTFDSCYFPQSLTIYGNNITITRSQVHGTVTPHWSKTYDFGNLTLVDVEIEQTGVDNINSAAIAGHNYSCLRCNVHHTLSGMHFGNNTTIRDSYTHDFQYRDGAHGTGIGAGQGHGSDSEITHNNIQCNRLPGQPPICSSAMSIYPESNDQGGTVHNVTVKNNLFNAAGAYCVYAGGLPATNINFIDNWFGKKFYPGCAGYGPVTAQQPEGGQWVGNVWADGSGPVVP